MNENDFREEIGKIKYHIKLLGEAIDTTDHPVTSLVIDMDWNAKDLDDVHDIFERYDKMLNAGDEISWHEFEMDLRDRFNISYQTVKLVILAFYRNHQWTQVCHDYAMSFEPNAPVEFHTITRKKGSL